MVNASGHTPRPRNHNYELEAQSIIEGTSGPLCTAGAAAIILGVTGKHVRSLLATGKLKGCQLGSAWRVNVAALLDLAGID